MGATLRVWDVSVIHGRGWEPGPFDSSQRGMSLIVSSASDGAYRRSHLRLSLTVSLRSPLTTILPDDDNNASINY